MFNINLISESSEHDESIPPGEEAAEVNSPVLEKIPSNLESKHSKESGSKQEPGALGENSIQMKLTQNNIGI